MAVGNYTTFGSAVEKAIKKKQLSPAELKAVERLKQLSPAEIKIQADLVRKRAATKSAKPTNTSLKTTTKIAGAGSKAGGALKVAGKVAGKIAVPLAAIEQAYQTGMLIGSEEARERAAQEYEDLADDNALMRAGKGALGGVTTIYGAGRALYEHGETMGDVRDSYKKLNKKLEDPKNQSMIQEVKDRQATYMSLSDQEKAKVDRMGGKEAKQYLSDLKNPPSMKEGEPEFIGPPDYAKSTRKKSSEFVNLPEYAIRPKTPRATTEPEPPRATIVPEPPKARIVGDEDRAMALFQNTHGGPFDPKSAMDRGKMDAIKKLMAQKGSERLTPNQFSLQIYRQS